jgi:PAS domain S-box-containing protein
MRILVVDDERSIRVACQEILTKAGHQADGAEDGFQGQALIRSQRYDLVLLDLKMPGPSGLELLEEIQQLDPETVTIIITGYATIETAVEAIRKGAYDYIPKPFTPDALRRVVDRGLEKRRLALEAAQLRQERERSLLEVAQERSQTRTIIQCMTDGVLVANQKGQLVLFNPAALSLLKVQVAPQIGTPLPEAIPHPRLGQLLLSVLQEDRAVQSFVSEEIVLPGEPPTTLMVNVAAVTTAEGAIGAVAVLRDITKLKELERIKSDFVTMVAHELKAPLAAISGYVEYVLANLGENLEQERRMLERCRERTYSLLALIKDLLDISSLDSSPVTSRREPLSLGPVIRDTIDFLQGMAAEKGVEMEASVAADLPQLIADRREMERLLTNLLNNAIKYNLPGGKVHLVARRQDGFVRIEVRDTGIGIPAEALPHIFEEFYRVKSDSTRHITGTGLGLTIVRKIVNSYCGQIEVESEEGKGSTFTVLLPTLEGSQ